MKKNKKIKKKREGEKKKKNERKRDKKKNSWRGRGRKKRWKKDVRGWGGMKKRRRGFAEPGAPTS